MGMRMLSISAALVLLGLIGVACAGGEDGGRDGGRGGGVAADVAGDEPPVGAPEVGRAALRPEAASDADWRAVADDGYGGSVASEPGRDLPPLDVRVIKTADIRVRVGHGSFREAFDDAQKVAGRYGGFTSTASSGGDDSRRGSLVMRVPTQSFQSALADIKALGSKVLGEEISSQDVSEEFVDLEARLRNYEAQEEVLLGLMNRARSVADTIRVQRELQGIQLETERIKGRLRFLNDQTDMSTISVSMVEAGASPARLSRIERAWKRAVDTFVGMVAGLVASLGVVVPLALLIVLGYAVVRRVVPRPAA